MLEILLMEDNPADIALFEIGLKELLPACKLSVFDKRETLIKKLVDISQKENLNKKVVILDLFTPSNDGLDILKSIRQQDQFREIPILILTNAQETNLVQTAYEMGTNAFLFKPNDYDDFLVMLKGIVHFFPQQ